MVADDDDLAGITLIVVTRILELCFNPHRLDMSAKVEGCCIRSLAIVEDGNNRFVRWWGLPPIFRFLS